MEFFAVQDLKSDLGEVLSARQIVLGSMPRNIKAVTIKEGTLTPDADANYIVIPESFAGAQALAIACDAQDAKDAGEGTFYGGKCLIVTGFDFVPAQNLLYFYINASLGFGVNATAPEGDGNGKIKIPVSANRYFRAGLTYSYKVYYWKD